MFHVALKFQYLHTSAMYFCAGHIEDPWGWGQQPSDEGGGLSIVGWEIMLHHQPETPSAPASGTPPVIVPARVPAPVALP